MNEIEKVNKELEEAINYLNYLGVVNSYSLDTPEKKLNWDISYKKALDKFSEAYQKKQRLVNSY